MTKLITSFALCVFAFSNLFAQNNVQFSATDSWIAYMNVSQLPANGGNYEFGSAWALGDVKSTLDVAANALMLYPNFSTYANGPTDPYWVDQTTLEGNKVMEAITFVEPGASYNNNDLSFSSDVVANTLDNAYTVYFFIKALDPNNGYADALGGSKVFELPASGAFSVSATAAELATGLVIQYGFYVLGVNANPANESALGNVTIGEGTTNTSTNIFEEVENLVSVSPNPVMNRLSINSTSNVVSYDIVNLSGQLILSGKNENIVDVSTLTPGMYLLAAQLEEGKRQIIKFLKE
jgi:hypothetical protein